MYLLQVTYLLLKPLVSFFNVLYLVHYSGSVYRLSHCIMKWLGNSQGSHFCHENVKENNFFSSPEIFLKVKKKLGKIIIVSFFSYHRVVKSINKTL